MRLDYDCRETRFRRAYSRDDSQQIEVRVCAPGVGIGACGLGLLRPSREPEGYHRAPGAEQIEIAIAETRVFDRARQIKSKIVGCGGHRWNFAVGVKACISAREDTREQLLLLIGRHDIEPYGEDIGMLAEVFLRWRV